MKMNGRRESKLVLDKRKKMEEPTHPKAQQDNTFIRNEGLDAIKDIVKRNEEHKQRLEYKEPDDDAVANPEPIYEPDEDNGVALKRIRTDNVYKRGGYRKIPNSRNPYENNN